MRRPVPVGLLAVLLATVSFAGCDKKRGAAVVLEKEHIAAREVTSTPAAQPSASSVSPTPGLDGVAVYEEVPLREMAEDEIDVDGHVMKKDVRGTSLDPRAREDEQWIVRVQVVADRTRIKVQTDQARWEKIKVGDRVNVSYRQGQYTGTVWAAEIE